MKTNWPTKKLGEIALSTDYVANGSFASLKENVTYHSEENYAILVRTTDLQNNFRKKKVYVDKHAYDFLAKSKLFGGEVILSSVGSVGSVFMCPKLDLPMSLGPNAVMIRADDQATNLYLYFYFMSPWGQRGLIKISSATTQLKFNKTNLRNLDIPLPPLGVQKKIVAKLEKLLSKVDEAKKLREKSIESTNKLLSAELHRIFTEGKSKGWEEKNLKDISDYYIGLTYSPNDKSESGTIVLRSSNIQDGELDFNDIVRVTTKIKDNLWVKDGDILMCSRNGSKRLIGKTAMIKNLNENMTFGAFMTIIRSEYNPYLYWFFKSNDFFKQFQNGGGPMINQITKYMLNEIKVYIPEKTEQKKIVKRLDSLSEKIKKIQEHQAQTAEDLKSLEQSILHQAFNGNLV